MYRYRSLKIAAAALNQTPLDWKGNYARLSACLARASAEGVDILCFPELTLSSYGCEDLFLAQHVIEKSWKLLQNLAKQGSGLFFVVGMPLQHKKKTYNVLALVENTRIVGFYAKQQLARSGVYYEPRWFTAWPQAQIDTFEGAEIRCPIGEILHTYKGQRIGFEICEDIWHKERPAARYAAKGIDIILTAHASHFALGKHTRRVQLVQKSAKIYDCLFVYANMLGNEAGRILYDGSLMMAQKGKVVATAPRLSFAQSSWIVYHQKIGPRSTHRMDLFTSEEEEFAQSAALALFDYLRKSPAQGFVLSSSGGADSSMCAVLVSEMLGRALEEIGAEGLQKALPFLKFSKAERKAAPQGYALRRSLCAQLLTMVYQASKHSSQATFEAAEALAQDLGAHFLRWSIAEETQSYTHKVAGAIGRSFSWENDDIALQNIQARARTPALWLLANVLNALLLSTNNRNESSVGYATMDGDTAGSLAPLASVSKVFVLNWLHWAEKTRSYPGLKAVNDLVPTAELRPHSAAQSDEQDLMPYELLLAIEKEAIYHRRSPTETLEALREQGLASEATLKACIKKFFRLWAHNQWKRERLAPSFHLDTYSIDPKTWYRFPILSAGYAEELEDL